MSGRELGPPLDPKGKILIIEVVGVPYPPRGFSRFITLIWGYSRTVLWSDSFFVELQNPFTSVFSFFVFVSSRFVPYWYTGRQGEDPYTDFLEF